MDTLVVWPVTRNVLLSRGRRVMVEPGMRFSPDIEAASDESLVERARAGDQAAFDTLVRRHQAHVYGLALRMVGKPEAAEEILQETFLHVYQKLASFRGEAKFSTWLYRVATNAALMHRNRPAKCTVRGGPALG